MYYSAKHGRGKKNKIISKKLPNNNRLHTEDNSVFEQDRFNKNYVRVFRISTVFSTKCTSRYTVIK